MRTWATLLSLLLLSFPAFAGKEESLEQLLKRAESAQIKDQPPLYVEVAERQLKTADELYTNGNVPDARKAVEDVVTYCDRATSAATQSGKKLKHTEIAVRKMADK